LLNRQKCWERFSFSHFTFLVFSFKAARIFIPTGLF
jgi:hypothetical protein